MGSHKNCQRKEKEHHGSMILLPVFHPLLPPPPPPASGPWFLHGPHTGTAVLTCSGAGFSQISETASVLSKCCGWSCEPLAEKAREMPSMAFSRGFVIVRTP